MAGKNVKVTQKEFLDNVIAAVAVYRIAHPRVKTDELDALIKHFEDGLKAKKITVLQIQKKLGDTPFKKDTIKALQEAASTINL